MCCLVDFWGENSLGKVQTWTKSRATIGASKMLLPRSVIRRANQTPKVELKVQTREDDDADETSKAGAAMECELERATRLARSGEESSVGPDLPDSARLIRMLQSSCSRTSSAMQREFLPKIGILDEWPYQ